MYFVFKQVQGIEWNEQKWHKHSLQVFSLPLSEFFSDLLGKQPIAIVFQKMSSAQLHSDESGTVAAFLLPIDNPDFRKCSPTSSSIFPSPRPLDTIFGISHCISIPQKVPKQIYLAEHHFLKFFPLWVHPLIFAYCSHYSDILRVALFTCITNTHVQLGTISMKNSISKAHLYRYLYKICDKAFSQIKCWLLMCPSVLLHLSLDWRMEKCIDGWMGRWRNK